jgi:bifunctional non-homologous end joining protein LigD
MVSWPIAPMKAVGAAKLPAGDGWVYEPKWDGHRVLVRRRGDHFAAVSSTGKPKDTQWPWLRTVVVAATDHDVILDGEVVAYGPDGRHSFQRVGRRDHRHAFVVFDILTIDGEECLGAPWHERRGRLLAAVTAGAQLSVTPVSEDAEAIEQATRAMHFEGVIAKRSDSTYQPGRRAPSWVKVKYRCEQEMVVGGYKLGGGNRTGSFASLLVGVHDERGVLRYVTAVGTGFDDATLGSIMAQLRSREVGDCPFDPVPKLPRTTLRWVRPDLVAQVAFHEWTEGGGVRAPVFLGLRDDKRPADVVREP